MSYTWKDALSKIGKQLNEKIEKSTIHIDDNVADLNEKINSNATELNGTISNIDLDITNVKNNIGDIKNDLSAIDENIQKINNNRTFKPKFGYTPYWGSVNSDGTWTYFTLQQMKSDIDLYKKYYLDELSVYVHIGYSTSLKDFIIACDLDAIKQAIIYSDGFIKNIRIHSMGYNFSTITSYGKDNYIAKYKQLLTQICNTFSGLGIENIFVFNEQETLYQNSDYKQFIIDCLNIAKSKNFKSSIISAGIENIDYIDSDIINACDYLCSNNYPYISGKGKYTTQEDCNIGFEQCRIDKWVQKLKLKYPGKLFKITECGVKDYYEALVSPSAWNYSNGEIATNGEVPKMFLIGMLNFFSNIDDIDSVWWWYDLNYGTSMQNVIKKYTRGEYYNV